MAQSSRYGELWSRDELVLAFELYCRIPFAKTKASNPEVQRLAHAIGRTPASVARKLGNFGAFDPELQKRNISGLGHGSKLDREVWLEFNSDWEGLIEQAQTIKAEKSIAESPEALWPQPNGPSEKTVAAKRRLHQAFFREAVLSSYMGRCAVTGLCLPECLIASHIVPWSVSKESRANPMNGLCLSATFDRLFDCGLMTVSDNYAIEFSPLVTSLKDSAVSNHLVIFNGQQILLPERFMPGKEFLAWHRENCFQKS